MECSLYTKMVDRLDLFQGDRIFISSDITLLAYNSMRNGVNFDANMFIDALLEKVGPLGTIVFPTYNWDFCKGVTFDYHKTKSKVGSLTNIALKRGDFKRTLHPIYSFAVSGEDQDCLCSLENKSAFGQDSPFDHFYKFNYKNLFIDVDYKNSATFVHYCEEKVGVSYRFLKTFTGEYIDEDNQISQRTYSMYVRPLDKDVDIRINPMGEIFDAKGAARHYVINGSQFTLLNMHLACDLVCEDILTNRSRRIACFEGQEDL